MFRSVFAASLVLLIGCGSSSDDSTARSCRGLDVQVLDSASRPPANVSARVRVTDCAGEALPRPIAPENFELKEDDRSVPPEEALRLIVPASRGREQRTLIALDLSGSIVRSGLRGPMIAGARQLTEQLVRDDGPEHQVAIFGFDGRAELVPFGNFSSNLEEISAALSAAENAPLVDDSTNLNGAVVSALAVLDGAVARPGEAPGRIAHGALVVFTDGADLAGRVPERDVRQAVEDTPHSTFAIGVGGDLDETALSRIARTHTAVASGPDEVIDTFEEIGSELRALASTDYFVSYCSPARSGSRNLDIRVTSGELIGEARIHFEADGFGAGCAPDTAVLP